MLIEVQSEEFWIVFNIIFRKHCSCDCWNMKFFHVLFFTVRCDKIYAEFILMLLNFHCMDLMHFELWIAIRFLFSIRSYFSETLLQQLCCCIFLSYEDICTNVVTKFRTLYCNCIYNNMLMFSETLLQQHCWRNFFKRLSLVLTNCGGLLVLLFPTVQCNLLFDIML